MIVTTLCFLVKQDQGRITEVCLAMKKRGFGIGKWNGVGGKVEKGESLEEAVRREAFEEIGVEILDPKKVAEINFYFEDKPEWDQIMHAYIATKWNNEPSESEEMMPRWYKVADIPYKKMWPDDIYWIPKVLEHKKITGNFSFVNTDTMVKKEVRVL
jgi:ADP-ribose pyrophosphatase YjhB (NUDIX family)